MPKTSGDSVPSRGAAVVEILLILPAMLLFLELIVLGGRVAGTNADIQSAAREGARQATLMNDRGDALAEARATALEALDAKGFQCQNPRVGFGAETDFRAGGVVEIEVTCTVNLSDLDLLSIPGSYDVTRRALEPIDTYRAIG